MGEIKRKEQKINNELFKVYFSDYQSPSNMYKKLSETKDAVNEVWVDSIKEYSVNYKELLATHLKIMHLRLKRMKR